MKKAKIITAFFWMLVEVFLMSEVLYQWKSQGVTHVWPGVIWFSVVSLIGYWLTSMAINKK